MPIQTDLNVSPYYDDYDQTKDYYKILFRPGVAVQARELNQLQTILQKQIERFGDHILKRGTIVDGCHLVYHDAVPYVKIKDTTISAQTVNVSTYENLVAKSTNQNLKAYVITTKSGFEAQDPNLNTLYVRYLNSGDSQNAASFSSGDILTIYNNDRRLYSVKINDGSTGFTDSDKVVFLSALALQNTTGGTTFSNNFAIGETVTQTSTGAQAKVVASNTTANASVLVLQIEPLSSDLATSNTTAWTSFATGYEITGATSGTIANTVALVGSGATGIVKTAAGGRIDSVTVTSGGSGYYVIPHVTAYGTANTTQIEALDLTAANYIANVTVSSVSNSTGVGYAMTVGDGIIYQKGYFSRVEKQLTIVEKYSNTPHQKVVGFSTTEAVVNSNSDSTLLDNATGTLNTNAPGANRLKLTPSLTVKTKAAAEADAEFFPITEFSEGKPFRQNRTTEYNKIADEMARRTQEESGNYVLDPFLVTTRSVTTFANEANNVSIVIDPGHAYINGYRVQTLRNYVQNVDKAKIAKTADSASFDIVYGNYVKVNEVMGSWGFTTGTQVSLRDTAANAITTKPDSPVTGGGSGNEIGKARVRSLVYESGEPGSPNAVYRLYVFDVRMNTGKNFKDVKSIYYDGATSDAEADVVLETDATTGNSVAKIKEPEKNRLLFTGPTALKSLSNVSYTYRTVDNTLTCNTAGVITLTSGAGETWPYSGALTTTEQQDLVVVPMENIVAAANSSGSVSFNGANVTGTSTSFVTEFNTGDYIQFNDGANTDVARVTAITNNTFMTIQPTVTTVAAGANLALVFPQDVVIPIHTRTDRTANVTGSSLHINLGTSISAESNVAVTYNTKVSNASPVTKTVVRKNYVKIQANTHAANTTGPWCIGFSDAFRLRAVYTAATTAVNTNSTDVTNEFYIDHNENENYYDVGYLYKKPTSTYAIGSNDVLLVEFDILTHSGEGIKHVGSYNIDDTKTLAQHDANTTMSTLEIPEVFGVRGDYYDLRDAFDFRPKTTNTVAQSTTSGSAPINPSEPSESTRFSASGKKFPVPESDIFMTYEAYLPRTDSIIVKANGEFQVLKDEVRMGGRKDEIVLSHVKIPPYPSLPESFSADLIDLTDTKIANEKYTNLRNDRFKIKSVPVSQQPRGYTMEQIGKLERRIEALEYYARLTETEDEIANKVIPSSVDATIDRYKFGFFVDNYTTEQYSDKESPEYNASIFEFRLYPAREDLSLSFEADADGENIVFPYESYTLVSQPQATDGPVDSTDTGDDDTTGVSYTTEYASYGNKTTTVGVEQVYTLTQNTSANGVTCTLYFALNGAQGSYAEQRIEIYQSDDVSSFDGSPIRTSENAAVLSQADRNSLTNDNVHFSSSYYPGDWSKTTRPDFVHIAEGVEASYWTRYAGKIQFNYNAANGRYIKVKIFKSGSTSKGRAVYYFAFPADDLGTPQTDTYLAPTDQPVSRPIMTIERGDESDNTTTLLTFRQRTELDGNR